MLRWDGDELHGTIIDLLDHESPTMQLLAAKVLEERSKGVSTEGLPQKLNNSDAAVAAEIWSVLAKQRDQTALQMIAWLQQLPKTERWSPAAEIYLWLTNCALKNGMCAWP